MLLLVSWHAPAGGAASRQHVSECVGKAIILQIDILSALLVLTNATIRNSILKFSLSNQTTPSLDI